MKFNIRFSLKMRKRNASQNGKNGEICQKAGNGIALENFSKFSGVARFYLFLWSQFPRHICQNIS